MNTSLLSLWWLGEPARWNVLVEGPPGWTATRVIRRIGVRSLGHFIQRPGRSGSNRQWPDHVLVHSPIRSPVLAFCR